MPEVVHLAIFYELHSYNKQCACLPISAMNADDFFLVIEVDVYVGQKGVKTGDLRPVE